MVIVSALLGLVMVLLGLLPNVANQAIEGQLRTVFVDAQRLEARLTKIPSLGMVTGSVDRFDLVAEGFKLGDLRVASLTVGAAPIDIALGSKPTLRQPTRAAATLVIRQEGFDELLRSEAVLKQLEAIPVGIDLPMAAPGSGGTVAIQEPKVELAAGRIKFSGTVAALGGFVTIPVTVATGLRLADPQTLALVDPEITLSGEPLAAPLMNQALAKINPYLDLRKLDTPMYELRLHGLELAPGSITVRAGALLKALPS